MENYKKYLNFVVNDVKTPYFYNLENVYGIAPSEYEEIFSKLFNQFVSIKIDGDKKIYDSIGNILYFEHKSGNWFIREYKDSLITYELNSGGNWFKWEYDENGNVIYYLESSGHWETYEYDENGDEIYYETGEGEILEEVKKTKWEYQKRDIGGSDVFYKRKKGDKKWIFTDEIDYYKNYINESKDMVNDICNTMSVKTYEEGVKLLRQFLGDPKDNISEWEKIKKPLKMWKDVTEEIRKEKKIYKMTGDSEVDESNTWWSVIIGSFCK